MLSPPLWAENKQAFNNPGFQDGLLHKIKKQNGFT